MPLPSIFIWKESPLIEEGERHFTVYAMTQDGTMLVLAEMHSLIYAKHLLGLNSKQQHELYNNHYPEGWVLVDLTELNDDQLDTHPEFTAALDRWDRAVLGRGEVVAESSNQGT